jgi:hypothetical protein
VTSSRFHLNHLMLMWQKSDFAARQAMREHWRAGEETRE